MKREKTDIAENTGKGSIRRRSHPHRHVNMEYRLVAVDSLIPPEVIQMLRGRPPAEKTFYIVYFEKMNCWGGE